MLLSAALINNMFFWDLSVTYVNFERDYDKKKWKPKVREILMENKI